MSVVADVTNPDDCERVVDTALDRFGRLDILYSNVGGGGGSGSVVDATDS